VLVLTAQKPLLEQFDHHQNLFRCQVAIHTSETLPIDGFVKNQNATDVFLEIKQ